MFAIETIRNTTTIVDVLFITSLSIINNVLITIGNILIVDSKITTRNLRL